MAKKMTSLVRVGIVGATGYAGIELCRLLSRHSEVRITHLFSRQHVGKRVRDLYPHLVGLRDFVYEGFSPDQMPDVDLLFLALPHGHTHTFMGRLMGKELKIIDLSADFRLSDAGQFQKYYGEIHQHPELLDQVSYGIPELFKDDIRAKQVCAAPGCYPTASILGVYPLVQKGLVSGSVVIDAKSGVSGAGKALKETSLYCEANGNVSAYSTGNHRHEAEIDEILGVPVVFSPHLVHGA